MDKDDLSGLEDIGEGGFALLEIAGGTEDFGAGGSYCSGCFDTCGRVSRITCKSVHVWSHRYPKNIR